MAKIKAGKWEITDEEFAQQYAEATERGDADHSEPCAKRAFFSEKTNSINIELESGITIAIPRTLIQGLSGASVRDVTQIEILPGGTALHWNKMNVGFTVRGLMSGIYGTRAWMADLGRKGGKATSPAKAAAARANGKKGGRPTRQVAVVMWDQNQFEAQLNAVPCPLQASLHYACSGAATKVSMSQVDQIRQQLIAYQCETALLAPEQKVQALLIHHRPYISGDVSGNAQYGQSTLASLRQANTEGNDATLALTA